MTRARSAHLHLADGCWVMATVWKGHPLPLAGALFRVLGVKALGSWLGGSLVMAELVRGAVERLSTLVSSTIVLNTKL